MNKKRGSLTAEASIVLPVVILFIMMIIRLCVLHYQNVVLSSEAMRVASRAGMYWNEIGGDAPSVLAAGDSARNWITDASFTLHDPYSSLVELVGSSQVQAKLNNAEAYAGTMVNRVPNLLGEETAVKGIKVGRDTGLMQNYITVKVTRKNEDPLSYLYEKLGLVTEEEYEVTAKGIQADMTEFMRNVSLLYDVVKGDLFQKSK